jgi:hypothetical protein
MKKGSFCAKCYEEFGDKLLMNKDKSENAWSKYGERLSDFI